MALGFFVLLVACLFQGSFGICFKKYQPFSWEAFWVLFSVVGVLLIPHIWAAAEVPNYMQYISQTPKMTLFLGALAGFLWGISAIWYSKSINLIGVSLVSGINLGLSNLLGSLVPMVILGTVPQARVLGVLLLGQAVLIAGVVVLSKAGFLKNNQMNLESVPEPTSGGSVATMAVKKKQVFVAGFIMALASGAGSAAINIGAAASNFPSNLAIAAGVNPTSASLLSWVVVFFGGFWANFLYALSVMIKNKTFSDYFKPGCGKAYFKVILTSFVWFAALAIYGKATALLGTLGPVVGWVAFNGLALIIANGWGFLDKEWKGYPKARNVAIVGNIIILFALVIVGISNGL